MPGRGQPGYLSRHKIDHWDATMVLLPSTSRVHADANTNRAKEYWDYESHVVNWANKDDYQLGNQFASGCYSGVYHGIEVANNEKCAVKILAVRFISKVD